MTQIYVAGIAMTVFGRHLERSLHDLAGEALTRALTDADQSSATLLIFLLKARLPEVYREKIVHEVNLRFANTLIADVTLILRKHLPVELSNTIAKELEALSNRLVGQSE